MTPIKTLFRLLVRFVPMEDGEYTKSLDEATNWYNEIPVYKEGMEGLKGFQLLMAKYKLWAGKWYGVVAHSILYIILVRGIQDFMAGEEKADATKFVD